MKLHWPCLSVGRVVWNIPFIAGLLNINVLLSIETPDHISKGD